MSTPLAHHVRADDLGVVFAAETGFKVGGDPDTARVPAFAFVRREHVEAVGEVEGYWPEAPELTLELVSPTDRFAEVEEKVADWLAAGTRTVLVIDPQAKTVTSRPSEKKARILSEAQAVDGGEVVPGWRLPVADVFR